MLGQNNQSKEIIRHIPNKARMAELGVWKGQSSKLFAEITEKLYLVDSWSVEPYKESAEHGGWKGYLEKYSKMVGSNDPNSFQKYYDNVFHVVKEEFKYHPNVTVKRMTTNEFFNWFFMTLQPKLDCVYLDASHEYKQVLSDLKQCKDVLLKPAGILFGDDYRNKPGVKQAVDEFVSTQTNATFNNFYENQYMITWNNT